MRRIVIADDLPVAHADHPIAPRRHRGIVRDQHHGLTVPVDQVAQDADHLSPLALSRLPVGSSARMMAGPATSARATATRCCSPPESWLGK